MATTNEVREYFDAELWEDVDGDTHCELKNGFKVTYWEQGLSDLEYIRRTKEIQRIEKERNNGPSGLSR